MPRSTMGPIFSQRMLPAPQNMKSTPRLSRNMSAIMLPRAVSWFLAGWVISV